VSKLSVEKLNGKNYIVWAAQMESLLAAKGTWKYVESTITLPAPGTGEYSRIKKEQESFRAFIMCTIEGHYVPMIITEKDSHKTWMKLKLSFKYRCAAAEHTLRSKLMSMKMNEKDTIRKYAKYICYIVHELTFAGHTTNEADTKFVLLNGLRGEFSMKKAILQERLANTGFEELIGSLEKYEEELKRNDSPSGSSSTTPAFFTSRNQNRKKRVIFARKITIWIAVGIIRNQNNIKVL